MRMMFLVKFIGRMRFKLHREVLAPYVKSRLREYYPSFSRLHLFSESKQAPSEIEEERVVVDSFQHPHRPDERRGTCEQLDLWCCIQLALPCSSEKMFDMVITRAYSRNWCRGLTFLETLYYIIVRASIVALVTLSLTHLKNPALYPDTPHLRFWSPSLFCTIHW